MDKIPPLSADLIKELDREIPHRCAAPGQSTEEIFHYAGMRALVDMLLRVERETNDNILANPNVF